MAPLIYLDTHVMAWLYAGQVERIPAAAQKAINESEVLISPMALVELQCLIEIGRFTDPVEQVLAVLGRDLGLKVCELPFAEVARRAFDLSWTRDPFDRLIVSQASLREAPLVTKDGDIHEHYRGALWTMAPAGLSEESGPGLNRLHGMDQGLA
jgi:PIN domain nuclease of toxin-antitoxin system